MSLQCIGQGLPPSPYPNISTTRARVSYVGIRYVQHTQRNSASFFTRFPQISSFPLDMSSYQCYNRRAYRGSTMTMMRSESEMEELIAKNQLLGLCISALLVMVLVWATLPSEDAQLINSACAQQCRELVDLVDSSIPSLPPSLPDQVILSPDDRTLYFDELNDCYDACMEKE